MSKKKGFKSSVFSIVWKFIVIGGVVAFFMIKGGPGETIEYFKRKSDELRPQIINCLENNDCSFGGPIKTEISSSNSNSSNSPNEVNNTSKGNEELAQTNDENKNNKSYIKTSLEISSKKAKEDLNSLKVVDKYDDVSYKRTEWKHWSTFEHSCWNTREEALFRQAEDNTVVLTDKDDNEVSDKTVACGVKTGKWKDPYSEEEITDPAKADLDHTIPLKLAARMGGQSWTKQYKEEFANDLDHLVITTQKQNRTKGDKGPSDWMPPNYDSHCDYAKIFIHTAKKYELNISKDDKQVLEIALDSCK